MTPKNELLFCGLGGSGEIGMNVNLYGCQGKWVMVDLGITFADPQYPGVDVILPDLSFIEDRIDDLLGIVITHGHEDHIGSLPYLAEDLGVPIYATPFTMGLIRGKLEEEGIANRVKLKMIPMGGNFQLGPFGFTFVEMSHSIPEANALLIDTPYGRVFHTGDWKLDKNPVIGNPTTPEGFMAIGDKGVDVLVCDSTNIFNTTASGSESTVRKGLFEEVSKAKGRVMITSFASNAARLHTFGEVAKETGRKLCVTGRSLDRIIKVARATGYLKDFPDTISPDEAMRLPKNKVLIIATGGQGEERAALARVANGQHTITLDADDTVIFSSKQIPGNEVQIGRIQNTLAAKGIRMITERQAHVHVSGHPGQPELAQMYDWLRPEVLVPTHGEMRHMMEHARFGLEQGIPRAIVQSNGDIIRLAPKGPAKIGNATVGRLVLDGDVILPADGATLSERRKLAINGQISVGVALGKDGRMVGQPQVRVQGVPVEEDRAAFIADAVQAAADTVRGGKRESEKMREQIRLAVRKVAKRWTGKQPIVDVLLIEG
ncbi:MULTISPECIES: ribonuclease J [unclassified Sphingomonas]|uniref:ribonuclease J n=1 Tax=unclassified Sphingomonas TaxID=196159 RepID=UPI0006F53488|nr:MULTISPECIES: ribonuclease J [unclassified Sphingomonas]KQS51141.1 MBL fold metallo-hydrolase [Sphingomonas sp. Leaf198]RKE50188.1 ribonuclease J [Sphingomonas sp. PP-CC-1A-547]RMB36119.1 ribonuclease J [Sphingomonas sp. PP-F2F-G114-C0414]TCM08522.1 ribonuclease J [Sphingomonas sp. PP-CC-3G-468]TCP92710.1 ribonuclease J [Sphingomonas sp. PP-CE-1A-559]